MQAEIKPGEATPPRGFSITPLGARHPGNGSLTLRTDAKEFQPMRHLLESVSRSNSLLHLTRKALLNLNHGGAFHTDQMVMVAVIPLVQQLESSPIAEVKPFNHAFL